MKPNKIKSFLETIFGIDARSLGIFRICMALIVIADLILRFEDIEIFFTDYGALPRILQMNKLSGHWDFSIHFINGTYPIQVTLFLLHGIFALFLLFGYKTRAATILTWAFTHSLYFRNPTITYAGDIILRLMLFWSMFLPLGVKYSVDGLLNPNKEQPKQIFSVGTTAILLQAAFVYFFAALLKTGPEWHHTGTAVSHALSDIKIVKSFGLFIKNYPLITKSLTYFVYWLEFIGPVLLFFPIWNHIFRIILLVLFAIIQIGFGLCLNLQLFPFDSSLMMIPFIPGIFWDKLPHFEKIKNDFIASLTTNKLFLIFAEILPPSKVHLKPWFASEVIAACFLIFITISNISTVYKKIKIPDELKWINPTFGLTQKWGMFASPLSSAGWYVISGTLSDGNNIDLNQKGKPLSFEKPVLISKSYKNTRWVNFMTHLRTKESQLKCFYFSRYLCNKWNSINRNTNKELKDIEIIFMKLSINPDLTVTEPERITLWKQGCQSNY
jgi:hypothetical protein